MPLIFVDRFSFSRVWKETPRADQFDQNKPGQNNRPLSDYYFKIGCTCPVLLPPSITTGFLLATCGLNSNLPNQIVLSKHHLCDLLRYSTVEAEKWLDWLFCRFGQIVSDWSCSLHEVPLRRLRHIHTGVKRQKKQMEQDFLLCLFTSRWKKESIY